MERQNKRGERKKSQYRNKRDGELLNAISVWKFEGEKTERFKEQGMIMRH